ncbi:hypothetical protein QBC45DRAFT_470488 [Copromyces sp. CBS 386.78]|nr:hypothetical protein QBC45DRAFT_470488 [Copromyces sp. CBS 386.78]
MASTSSNSRAASPMPSSLTANPHGGQINASTQTQTDTTDMEPVNSRFQRSSAPSPSPTLSSLPSPSFHTPTTSQPSIPAGLEPTPSIYSPRPEPLTSSADATRSSSPVGVGPTRPGSPARLVSEFQPMPLVWEMPSSPVLAHSVPVPVPVPVGARVVVPGVNPMPEHEGDSNYLYARNDRRTHGYGYGHHRDHLDHLARRHGVTRRRRRRRSSSSSSISSSSITPHGHPPGLHANHMHHLDLRTAHAPHTNLHHARATNLYILNPPHSNTPTPTPCPTGSMSSSSLHVPNEQETNIRFLNNRYRNYSHSSLYNGHGFFFPTATATAAASYYDDEDDDEDDDDDDDIRNYTTPSVS